MMIDDQSYRTEMFGSIQQTRDDYRKIKMEHDDNLDRMGLSRYNKDFRETE